MGWSGPRLLLRPSIRHSPELFIDGGPGPQMQSLSATGQWYAVARIEQLGVLHSFYYQLSGAKFGGRFGPSRIWSGFLPGNLVCPQASSPIS